MTLSPAELVKSAGNITSLPAIFEKVNRMMDDPLRTPHDISKVISTDPALTTRLLRIVNSPFYGFPSRIDSVSRAIILVGTQELRELLLATSVLKTFSQLPDSLVSMEQYWKNSIYCAVVARIIGARLHEANIERFFIAALLRNIGSLLIYQKIPELARESILLAHNNEIMIHEAEFETFGFDHAEVGGELIRAWRLPAYLVDAVAYHHSPSLTEKYPLEVSIVHVADIICSAVRLGHDGLVPALEAPAWKLISLPVNAIDEIISEADKQFEEVFSLIYKN